MDAHVQKQTYYQLRGTSWIIGIGWQQHSRATNYLSQQANSRLSKTQNLKKKIRVEIFVKVKLKSKLLKGENILKTNSNPYQLHASKMLFLSPFECLAVKINSYSLFRPGFDHELNT